MKEELIKQYNNCSLGFYVNLEASGIDNEDGDLSADDFANVEYQISDGKLLSWDNQQVMDLDEIDDSWWEDAAQPVEGQEPMSEFDCFIIEIMNLVIQNEYIGYQEFEELIDDERILIVLLKDQDFNVIEEVSEWNIVEHID